MKPILIGEAPGGRGHEVQPALEGKAGQTLAKLMGVSYEEYLERFDRRNLFETPYEGQRWNAREAILRAHRLMGSLQERECIVLLGEKVAAAFGAAQIPINTLVSAERVFTGKTFYIGRTRHPSGRNRALNDPVEREKMGRFLRDVSS